MEPSDAVTSGADAMMRLGAIGPDVFRLHGEGRYAEGIAATRLHLGDHQH